MDRQPLEYQSAPNIQQIQRPYNMLRRWGQIVGLTGFATVFLTGMLDLLAQRPLLGTTVGMVGIALVILGVATMMVAGAAGAVHAILALRKKRKMQ